MSKSKLFLLDAYALIYRSYFAFIRNPMRNSEGFNTSTIFGFVSILDELLTKYSPTHFGVAFDLSEPTFRHELYPEYKANRESTPEDIRMSVPIIRDIIQAMGIPILEKEGYEADDVIGTLSNMGANQGYEVYMITPDKDYMQLVGDNIYMLKPGKNGNPPEIIDTETVCSAYSLDNPSQFIDILALMGDSSDNIPGAFGIGEKGAISLIKEYKSVENLLDKTELLKGKMKEKVLNSKENIILSKKLAKICLDVPIKFDPNSLCIGNRDTEKLAAIYRRMNFKKMLQKLTGEATVVENDLFAQPKQEASSPQQGSLFDIPESLEEIELKTINDVNHRYHKIIEVSGIKSLIETISKCKEFCFDTETTSLTLPGAKLVSVSFSIQERESWVVLTKDDTIDEIIEIIKPIFENPNIRKIGQNIKFDCSVLKSYGINVKGELWDTMLAHYLLQPEQRHNLNYMSETYLKYSPIPIESLIGNKGKSQITIDQADEKALVEYAGEDTDITLQLKNILKDELYKEGLESIAQNIEMPLAKVLSDMEMNGVKVCPDCLSKFSKELSVDIDSLEKEIYDLAGSTFNISSPLQLGQILFEKLKVDDAPKKTKTKQFSTQEDVLVKLIDKHPIISKILEYRGLKKLKSTYADALPKLINPITDKIHTSFNQAVTSTGRLSSTDPNLQNIPIREAKGREIRKAFIASDEEHLIMSADYSQVELRLMAHISQDPQMIEAFNRNEDIHTSTAAKIYNVPPEEVTREMRTKAKTANFGIIYGISAFGLAQRLNIPRFEAKALIDGYFAIFPGVSRFMQNAVEIAREKGYVETLFGRRRYIPDIKSGNANVRAMAERFAINTPIQGTAADIIKLAMIRVSNKISEIDMKSKMILQVHDELVFDVYKPELEQMKELVKEGMENAYTLKVPLLVEIGIGDNWLDAH